MFGHQIYSGHAHENKKPKMKMGIEFSHFSHFC